MSKFLSYGWLADGRAAGTLGPCFALGGRRMRRLTGGGGELFRVERRVTVAYQTRLALSEGWGTRSVLASWPPS